MASSRPCPCSRYSALYLMSPPDGVLLCRRDSHRGERGGKKRAVSLKWVTHTSTYNIHPFSILQVIKAATFAQRRSRIGRQAIAGYHPVKCWNSTGSVRPARILFIPTSLQILIVQTEGKPHTPLTTLSIVTVWTRCRLAVDEFSHNRLPLLQLISGILYICIVVLK